MSKENFAREIDLLKGERDRLSAEVSSSVQLVDDMKSRQERMTENSQKQAKELEKVGLECSGPDVLAMKSDEPIIVGSVLCGRDYILRWRRGAGGGRGQPFNV